MDRWAAPPRICGHDGKSAERLVIEKGRDPKRASCKMQERQKAAIMVSKNTRGPERFHRLWFFVIEGPGWAPPNSPILIPTAPRTLSRNEIQACRWTQRSPYGRAPALGCASRGLASAPAFPPVGAPAFGWTRFLALTFRYQERMILTCRSSRYGGYPKPPPSNTPKLNCNFQSFWVPPSAT
jgi:hypothetical protein